MSFWDRIPWPVYVLIVVALGVGTHLIAKSVANNFGLPAWMVWAGMGAVILFGAISALLNRAGGGMRL